MKTSAGLLLYRKRTGIEILLAHPGGPFYTHKDMGVWTLPKGESEPHEHDLLEVAKREFREETGFEPKGPYTPIGSVLRKDGKKEVFAWAFESDCNPRAVKSNVFKIEWPPKSGTFITAPEVDRVDFFSIDEAKRRINPYQLGLISGFEEKLHEGLLP